MQLFFDICEIETEFYCRQKFLEKFWDFNHSRRWCKWAKCVKTKEKMEGEEAKEERKKNKKIKKSNRWRKKGKEEERRGKEGRKNRKRKEKGSMGEEKQKEIYPRPCGVSLQLQQLRKGQRCLRGKESDPFLPSFLDLTLQGSSFLLSDQRKADDWILEARVLVSYCRRLQLRE